MNVSLTGIAGGMVGFLPTFSFGSAIVLDGNGGGEDPWIHRVGLALAPAYLAAVVVSVLPTPVLGKILGGIIVVTTIAGVLASSSRDVGPFGLIFTIPPAAVLLLAMTMSRRAPGVREG